MAEGEEVTISYVPRSAPRAARREALRRLHGFVCGCARCGPARDEGATAAGADAAAKAEAAEREREKQQQWLSAELAQCGAPLWRLRPEERCARVEAVLASTAAAERGPFAMWEVTLLLGHVSALAGRADQARRSYAEACTLAAALYGPASHRAKAVAAFAGGRGAASEREVIAFETLRAAPAFARWSGLPESVWQRWRRPIRAEATAGKSVAELAADLAELGRRALAAAEAATPASEAPAARPSDGAK